MKKDIINLNERVLDTIYNTAAYGFLTTEQLRYLHYPNWTLENTSQKLRSLTSTKERSRYLTRVYAYPKATTEYGGRKKTIYFVTKKNLATLQNDLEAQGKAGKFDEYRHFDVTDRETYAPQTLWHELAISQFFINLEDAAEQHGITIPFWERTSTKGDDIKETFTATVTRKKKTDRTTRSFTAKRHFNPDAVFCLQRPNAPLTFYILEYDNNTTSVERFKQKLEGLAKYHALKKYPDLISYYAHKKGLAIGDPEKIGVFVLNVSTNDEGDHRRRNRLFYNSLEYQKYIQFMFASMDECTPDRLLTGKIWMRGKEYPTATDHLKKILSPDPPPAVLWRYIQPTLNDHNLMPRVSLID